MSQHDYDFANQSGALFRSDLNSFAGSIVSNNSGASEPATKFAYMWWVDTTSGWLKLRNSTNTAWIKISRLSSAGSIWRAISSRSVDAIIVDGDFGSMIRATAAFTQTLAAASTYGNGFWFSFRNDSGSDCIIDPSGAELINGSATMIIPASSSVDILCSGSAWHSRGEIVLVETGSIKPWPSASTPAGWLECDRAEYLQAAYPALYSAIGTTFNDGSETSGGYFRVPDLRGRTPIGAGTGTVAETATGVDDGADTFTVASNYDTWITGMKVQLSTTGTLPTNLATATDYWLIRISDTLVAFATTLALAQNGTKRTFTGIGTGNHRIIHTLNVRALGSKLGEEAHAMSITELLAHTHGLNGGGQFNASGGSQPAMTFNVPAVNTNSRGGNSAMNNMSPSLCLRWLIKT